MEIKDFTPDETQTEAIQASCDVSKRVVSVTGPAGTGKTTILKKAYEVLVAAGYTPALTAPTGKAAKRIKEATGIPATTMHRLLEYTHPGERDPDTGKVIGHSYPKRDKRNPLGYDAVFGDEYAMVNHELHRNTFDALPPGGLIRVFGDIHQLNPIEKSIPLREKPSPFKELLENKKLKSVYLEHNYRQEEGSGIIFNAHRILKGFIPQRTEDFQMNITNSPIDMVFTIMTEAHHEGVDFASVDHQIITPGNKSWVGTVKLNASLQNFLRPETDLWQSIPRHKWIRTPVRMRPLDKVVITSNNYTLEVFNGETGIIQEITDYGEIAIDLGDRMVVIPPIQAVMHSSGRMIEIDPRKDIDLAYAMTTHKCQGSEYGHVIYVLNKSTGYVQSRPNFYTAVTRARKKVNLVSDQRSLSTSVWKM